MMRLDDWRQMAFNATPSSSEEERDDHTRHREIRTSSSNGSSNSFQTPYKEGRLHLRRSESTPMTVTQLTPSPIRSPLVVESVSSNPGTAPTRAPGPATSSSFSNFQNGYLEDALPTEALFRDPTPSRSRRKSRPSSRRSRLSQSLLLDGYGSPKHPPPPVPMSRMKSGHRQRKTAPPPSLSARTADYSEVSSSDSTPETSPHRRESGFSRNTSSSSASAMGDMPMSILPGGIISFNNSNNNNNNNNSNNNHNNNSKSMTLSTPTRSKTMLCVWGFVWLALVSSFVMISLARTAADPTDHMNLHEFTRPELAFSASGLRGQMTSGHWDGDIKKVDTKSKQDINKDVTSNQLKDPVKKETKPTTHKKATFKDHKIPTSLKQAISSTSSSTLKMHLPPPLARPKADFDNQDWHMYSRHSSSQERRMVALDPSTVPKELPLPRKIKVYPADFTDNTQLYSVLDSSDERLGGMELREPYSKGECVPMQDWQTTFHPFCNGMHEISIDSTLAEHNGNDINLFGTKGFWRYAWRLDVQNAQDQDTLVLKTLKFEHNFEDAHFEHDRVDAVAMERLTSSPHVINVFGYCGHSVLTEYADGSRVGELADKAKKKPLERLRIARDIANGLADVHGIDGDGNATFVHLDINPANVVSIGGTLKLNDFNIGIIRRWNTTSNKPCGFPAQYPNPQWRSPEEARNEQDLTEKVDVFSMGHIFFRLICGHEPWNKLEPGGRPSKELVNTKVRKGELPYIPEEVIQSKDPEVVAIREAMLACYTFEPEKRPSAREISKALQSALDTLLQKERAS